jgi:hypothetical protein
MYHKAWTGAGWQPDWEKLGGTFNVPPPTRLPPAPTQLDFDAPNIVFDDGTPVGGWSHVTLHQDGTYHFTGHFHDSGGTEYNMGLVWAVKDAKDMVYTFEHQGHVSGTFEPGPRDDDWTNDGQDDRIAQGWQELAHGSSGTFKADAKGDLTTLVNEILGAIGTVLAVVAIV